MTGVHTDIRLIRRCQIGCIFDHEHILGILLLGRFGEVERARDDRRRVDHHHFAVSNRVLRINERLDADVIQKRCGTVFIGFVGLVEDCEDLHSALVRRHKRFGNGGRGEGVGLHHHLRLRGVEFTDNRFCRTAVGGEVDRILAEENVSAACVAPATRLRRRLQSPASMMAVPPECLRCMGSSV